MPRWFGQWLELRPYIDEVAGHRVEPGRGESQHGERDTGPGQECVRDRRPRATSTVQLARTVAVAGCAHHGGHLAEQRARVVDAGERCHRHVRPRRCPRRARRSAATVAPWAISSSPAATDTRSRSALSASRSGPVSGLSMLDIVPVWEAVHAVSRRAVQPCHGRMRTEPILESRSRCRTHHGWRSGCQRQSAGLPARRPAASPGRGTRRCRTGCRAAALFADISGFTPLTEALVAELGPQRGAEELTAALERDRRPAARRARPARRRRHLLQR